MADIVTISGPVTYKAWTAPQVAIVVIGETEAKLPLEHIQVDALDALAKQWLDHLYASVGRASPFFTCAAIAKTTDGEG